MQQRFSVIVVSPSAAGLYEAVAASPHALTLARVDRPEEFASEVKRLRPRVVVLDVSERGDDLLDAYEALAERPFLIVVGPEDNRLLKRALRLGARDYLTPDVEAKAQLVRALDAISNEAPDGPDDESSGSVVAVMGTKGGTGATFVACQLAAGLARSGKRVVLVDLHLRTGDVALYLDLKPQYTFASLAVGEKADIAYIRTALVAHASGVQVLAAPARPEEGDIVSGACVERTLVLLKREFDYVVLDLPRDFDDRSVGALDLSDCVLMVSTPEVPALNRGNLQLDLLRRLGHPGARLRVVINRVDTASSPSVREIEAFLARPIDAQLPNDYPRAVECSNGGRTIWDAAGRGALAASFSKLVQSVQVWSGNPAPSAKPAAAGGLRRFFSRNRHGAA